jgi:hypothetical protein
MVSRTDLQKILKQHGCDGQTLMIHLFFYVCTPLLIIIRTGFVNQSAQETTAFSLFISRQTVLLLNNKGKDLGHLTGKVSFRISSCEFVSVCVSSCRFLSVRVGSCKFMSVHVGSCRFMSVCVGLCQFCAFMLVL